MDICLGLIYTTLSHCFFGCFFFFLIIKISPLAALSLPHVKFAPFVYAKGLLHMTVS